MSQTSKKSKREAARQARLEAERRRRQAQQRKKVVTAVAVATLIVAAAVVGVILVRSSNQNVAQSAKAAGCSADRTFDDQGQTHIRQGESHPAYNSNPPTSGWHYASPAGWGDYDQRVETETLVHNLEHGGVVVQYKDLPDRQLDQLLKLVDGYAEGVIVAPNPKIDKPIAITAWRHLMTCQRFSEPVVKDFIKERCGKGPEQVGIAC
ncbi:MAG: DUF3105 domain-containing protein [Actinomycetota bacterium]